MFSLASFINFVSINTIITAFSFVKYSVSEFCYDSSNIGNVIIAVSPLVVTEIVTNLFLIRYTHAPPKKKYIDSNSLTERKHEPMEGYNGEFAINMLTSSVVKGTIHYFVLSSISFDSLSFSSSFSSFTPFNLFFYTTTFILKSFLLEIMFDGCHYIIHRTAHSSPFLYKYIHKKHHKHLHPSVWTTFYMHPIDIVLSYGVPLYISLKTITITKIQFYMYITYLSLQEIAGHSGKAMYPSSGFAQCVWLPKLFNFELYTDDHDLHHTNFTCNYSKRFVLWDKLFGTYVQPPTIPTIKKKYFDSV